jgi:transcriptional regulator with XRE-family HTH domain
MSEGDVETEPGEVRGALAVFRRLGGAIRLMREQQGTSLANVARLSRTSKSQLSKYETGKELPKLESLARVLDALDLEPLTVFYWATRLARGVSQTDIRDEMLHAEVRHDAGSQPFQALLSAAFEAYRAYLEARMAGRSGREGMAG